MASFDVHSCFSAGTQAESQLLSGAEVLIIGIGSCAINRQITPM